MLDNDRRALRWRKRILGIRDVVSEDQHTLLLEGELDISSTPELEAIIARVCEPGTQRLTIDLSKVGFIDSSGISAIIAASRRCDENGCEFTATAGPPAVQRLFELTGIVEQPWFEREA